MKTTTNVLAALALVLAVSIATADTADAFPFFSGWIGVSGLDLGSGR